MLLVLSETPIQVISKKLYHLWEVFSTKTYPNMTVTIMEYA